MNTIKFQPITKKRTETHNVEVYSIKKMKFGEKEKQISSEAGLSIYVTNKCNAKCSFCMNMYEDNFLKCQELQESEYFNRLEYILEYLKPIKPAVLITGGETTKSAKLPQILKMLKEKGYKIRSFATNGSGLLDRIEGKTVVQHMLENGAVNNINISRMHYDEEKNNKIMKISEGITRNQLKQVMTFLNANEMDARIGCNLQKEGISTLEDMLTFKEEYKKLGADTVIFRELIPVDLKKEKSTAYERNRIEIKPIMEEIDKNSEFKYIRTMEGLQYIVKVYQYKDSLVKCYQEKEKQNPEIIKDLIFYANGDLVGNEWNTEDGILLRNEKGEK